LLLNEVINSLNWFMDRKV